MCQMHISLILHMGSAVISIGDNFHVAAMNSCAPHVYFQIEFN